MPDLLKVGYHLFKKMKKKILFTYSVFGFRYKKDRILHDIRKLGITRGDVIFVHSSLSRMGYVKGGANTVIDALIEAVGGDGTVIMPALTIPRSMKDTLESGFIFDPKRSKATVGVIPETFRKRKGTYRSIHPTHSVCAYGKLAKWITQGHELCKTTFGVGTPFHKFLKVNGKILGIGIDLGPITFYHVIEDIVENFPVKVYYEKEYKVKLFDHNGNIITMKIRPHDPNVGRTRIDYRKNLWIRRFLRRYLRDKKRLKEGRIGKAHSWFVKARDLYETQIELLEKNITIYSTKEFIQRKMGEI